MFGTQNAVFWNAQFAVVVGGPSSQQVWSEPHRRIYIKSQGYPIAIHRAMVRTARKYKKFGYPIYFENIWNLQNATTPELKKLHGAVIHHRGGKKKRSKSELASEESPKRAIRQTLKHNLLLEKLNASRH